MLNLFLKIFSPRLPVAVSPCRIGFNMRWIFFDEILEIKKGAHVRALGRLPETDISPEVLLIEMMAQAGGILLGAENDFKEDVVFAKIEATQFPAKIYPHEVVEVFVKPETLRAEGSWVEGTVKNSRAVFATGKIMLMNAGALVSGKKTSTTFHERFMQHFKIRAKVQ